MIKKNKFEGKEALLILGGPSVMKEIQKLSHINKDKFVVFCESKALTPMILNSKIQIDYLISPFADKCRDNSIQNFILRSFMAELNISKYLKKKYLPLADHMKKQFEYFYEVGRPKKSLHKKYRFKKDKYQENSPYDLLKKHPEIKVITSIIEDESNWDRPFMKSDYENQINYFKFFNNQTYGSNIEFSLENYFNPKVVNNFLQLEYAPFTNSVSGVIFAILKFLGFNRVFVAGMDMNMFGSCEFSVPYTFKSIPHFMVYLLRVKKAFGPHFKLNLPLWYLRPKSEFYDLKLISTYNQFSIIRLINNDIFAAKLDFLNTMHYDKFFEINY